MRKSIQIWSLKSPSEQFVSFWLRKLPIILLVIKCAKKFHVEPNFIADWKAKPNKLCSMYLTNAAFDIYGIHVLSKNKIW